VTAPAKAAILARIRAVDRGAPPAVPHDYRRTSVLGVEERAALFSERVADYRADVRRVGAADVAAAIAAVCSERGVTRVGVPAGFPAEWRPAEPEVVEDNGFSLAELDALGAVATGCTTAIAETGTIALAVGPSEGRRALSLVPDLHICVIREDQIVELVPEALAILGELVRRERRPLTLISGPSATSDIELSRVEGVHGPRNLVVLITREEES